MNPNFTWPIKVPDWDGQTEVSVIVPFCNEGPNVVFTTQALIEELDGFCKYEIILVDNCSDWQISCSVKNENMPLMEGRERPYPIRSRSYFQGPPGSKREGALISTMFFRKGVVKYLQYDIKQGHWNAKNWGVVNSKGKYLFFLDAHCIMNRDGLRDLVRFARELDAKQEKWGGLHAYINYMLDSRSLEYRPQKDKFFGYCFCTHQQEEYYVNGVRQLRFPTQPYKVCIMSTCAMMSPRSVMQTLGPWNPEYGIYCGGEGGMVLKQATCGYDHWIVPSSKCWHWAEKRGYQYWHGDFVRNEQIAAYTCGGERALEFCIAGRKGTPAVRDLADDVRAKCAGEMEYIKSLQVEDLESYFDRWVASPGVWK